MAHIISARESLYLDIARVIAALAVLLDHAGALFKWTWLPGFGHQAVIVFFVLSGYVISNVAETREATPRAFLIARFSRLWSVLVPAMVLTVLCDVMGRTFGFRPHVYDWSPIDYPLIRFGAALSFLSECWVSIQPFSNFAAWSLSLEFWYYMIFAAWWFIPPGRSRSITVGVALALSGHKGLLLFPIWLMGVALQHVRPLREFHRSAYVMFYVIGTLAGVCLLYPPVYLYGWWLTGEFLGFWIMNHLAEAKVFWYDWALGLAFSAHILGVPTVMGRVKLERFAGPIRWCAGISFAAYLFHMPLLHLFAAFLPVDQGPAAVALTIVSICLLGAAVERSKYRWRQWLNWAVDLAESRWLRLQDARIR